MRTAGKSFCIAMALGQLRDDAFRAERCFHSVLPTSIGDTHSVQKNMLKLESMHKIIVIE